MNFNKRVLDVGQVFDKQWNANHNYKEKQEFLDERKQHFNKMHNIVDKDARKKEILNASSVEGRVNRLEANMKSIQSNDLFRGKNNFR